MQEMTEESGLFHILVIDDDDRLRDLLSRLLRESGFLVGVVENVPQAQEALQAFHFDLAVLDVMMPGPSGLDLLKSRPLGLPPTLLLTAQGALEERIQGLALGADDYLAKPFDPRELLLRIRAILRRAAPAPNRKILFGPFGFDLTQHALFKEGHPLYLTSSEAKLLGFLMRHPHQILSRECIAEALGDKVSLRTVDVQINRLRQKIEENPSQPTYLQSIRGQGYRMGTDP